MSGEGQIRANLSEGGGTRRMCANHGWKSRAGQIRAKVSENGAIEKTVSNPCESQRTIRGDVATVRISTQVFKSCESQ